MESDAGGSLLPIDVVVGLGANIGAPELTLRSAVAELARIGVLRGVSRLYRSAPVGGPPQPDFLNAAVRLQFHGAVDDLLREAHRLERLAGRERRERWGPRTLDLDILWVGGVSVHREGLHVPHARLRERAFALRPLLDVAPEATDPVDGAAYRDVLERLGDAGVEPLRRVWAGSEAQGGAPGYGQARVVMVRAAPTVGNDGALILAADEDTREPQDF
jgi:2-amino-4-hydroxy-6-hydroxymethyldihydropteridine diphosphokinase